MTDDEEKSQSPLSLAGNWQMELFYYSVPGRTDKSRRGKAYRNPSDGELRYFESHDGTIYQPGDAVYIETSSADPYLVGSIVSFKMTKRDLLSVRVNRYFRPEDVPDISLGLILQERNEMDHFRDDPVQEAHARELFSSDFPLNCSVACLRGKCEVTFVKDIRSLDSCDLSKESSFFTCLTYNQESSRLASVQGEIRVGASYQAKLPPEASCSVSDEPDRDQLLYRPGQIDQRMEQRYIRLARSFRLFAMLDTKMTETEKNTRVGDLLFDDALVTLHRCGYKFNDAIREMNANDKLVSAENIFMSNEDSKKFGKGIKNFGKNFMRINKELLPLHGRDALVGYYYLWKKTAEATKPKALARARTQAATLKRGSNKQTKASRPASTEFTDYASASETEVEANETEGRLMQYACHHCYASKSRDWHHAGRMLLCTECRLHFKMYGTLRPVDRSATVPPCLFKRSPSGNEEEESGVRTRAGKKERRRTPSMGDDRRSPSQAVSIHEFDMEKISVKHRNGKRKRSHINGSAQKKKKNEEEREEDSGREEEKKEDMMMDIKAEGSSSPDSGRSNSSLKDTPVKMEPDLSPVKAPLTPKVEENMDETLTDSKEEMKPLMIEMEASTSGLNGFHHVGEHAVVNGKDVKEEVKLNGHSTNITMNGVEKEEESDEAESYYVEGEKAIWEPGSEVCYSTPNADFIQAIVRKEGSQCSRTDMCYKFKVGSTWDKAKKEKEERAKRPPPPPVVPATPIVKKPETNGHIELSRLAAMNGMQHPAFGNMDPAQAQMMQLLMMHQVQAAQQAQVAAAQQAAQQQAQAQMEQQQAQMMKQLEMQRQMEMRNRSMHPLMQMEQARMMQMVAAANGGGAPNGADIRQMQMFEQQMMAAQMNQLQLQMAAAAGHPSMEMLMNPQMMHMMQALGGAMGVPPGVMHPGMVPGNAQTNSDMMRRLQQEGFPMRPNP